MKKLTAKITLLASALAIAGLFTAPVLHAQDDAAAKTKAEKKAKRDAEILKKYDKNGNGKLDPDEEAAYKADMEKAKAEKKEKKEKKSEEKADK
jgi:hypothetical protein